jgi:hypothetical protein
MDTGPAVQEILFNTQFVLYVGYKKAGSRDSVVGIATGYGLDDREVGDRVPVG